MENIYLLQFLFLLYVSFGGAYETYCSSGERVHTPREGHDVCIPCQYGAFMDENNHSYRQCKPCTVIRYPDVEVLVSACNSTHDAVILCTGGFYRRRARHVMEEDRCEKCTECPFPARPCDGYYDTVCCLSNHDAVMTPDGVFVCRERPPVCGVGEFFRTSSEECLPCPAGTFMSAHNHTYKECLKCEELSDNNLTQAVIIRPCSRTAPTLFGCKAGYFRDPTHESLQIEVPCTPCRSCDRNLKDCGMFHDAVCDDEVPTAPANLTVFISMSKLIKQLTTTFNGSLYMCLLHCTKSWRSTLEDITPQSESSKNKCVWSCFPEINKARISAIQMAAGVLALMLVFYTWNIWRKRKLLVTDICSKLYSSIKFFACVLSSLNIVGLLFSFIIAIDPEVIEDYGRVVSAFMVYCCIVLILNIVLFDVIYVPDEVKLYTAPVNGKQKLELGQHYTECSTDDGTSD